MNNIQTQTLPAEHRSHIDMLIGPIIAVLLVGGLSAFISPEADDVAQKAFNARFGAGQEVSQITPAAYETLRDMVAEKPSRAKAVIAAFDNDDGIDTVEMRRIVGDISEDPAPTRLDLGRARGDLYQTAQMLALMPPAKRSDLHQE